MFCKRGFCKRGIGLKVNKGCKQVEYQKVWKG